MTIAQLTETITGLAETLAQPLAQVREAAEPLRGSAAATLEAAVAGAAAAAVAARLELLLAIEPRLPDATGKTLADALLDLEDELTDTVPDVITAQVFTADPRALPVIFGLMASHEELAELSQTAADASTLMTQLGTSFAGALGTQAGAAQAQVALRQFSVNGAALAQDLGETGVAVAQRSVTRVQAAARAGALSVFDRVRELALKLQQGHLARRFPGRDRSAISLDREVSGIVAGSLVLLDKAGERELYRVMRVASTSRAEFAVQAKSSSVRLAGQGLASYAESVRETAVHARSEVLPRARTPIAAPVSGDRFSVAADVRGLEAGRRLVIRGTRADNGQALVHDATIVSATPAALADDGGLIVFTPSLPAPLVRSSVVVHGNVAQASHGETVAQVLGSGDAAEKHQRFALQHAPLTHRAAATESGAQAELEVRVGDVAWQPRDTLYATGATERVFTTHTDEQGKVWIQFGDGVNGARLPSAANNLRARYRKGLGVGGNVRAEALSQAMARPLGFKGVSNPAAASGGTDPETSEVARRSMPLVTRTLGRVVSVLDYEDFARAYAGIAKAQARVLRLPGVSQGSVIALTVAATAGAPLGSSNPVWTNLLAALQGSGDPHVALRLLAAVQRTYRVGLKVKVDAAYDPALVLPRVEAALRAQGAFDARELGQPIHASDVIAAAHTVPGVVAVDLDFLCFAGTPLLLRQRLAARSTRAAGSQALPAEVLVLDPGPLARLEVMA